jgi:hypothetical protein
MENAKPGQKVSRRCNAPHSCVRVLVSTGRARAADDAFLEARSVAFFAHAVPSHEVLKRLSDAIERDKGVLSPWEIIVLLYVQENGVISTLMLGHSPKTLCDKGKMHVSRCTSSESFNF